MARWGDATRPPGPTKIVCVGRNYAAHARELGHAVPERPLLFFKPPSAVIGDGASIVLPDASAQVEHEAEIGVVIGRKVRAIPERDAMLAVAGYVALNDVTARDLQRLDGQWARAKGFDTFCPVGSMIPADGVDWNSLEVVGRVNGRIRQHGRAADMAFGIPALIAYVSAIMTLEPGDILATGTPEGVGPLVAGDVVEVEVATPTGAGSVVSNPVRGAGHAAVAPATASGARESRAGLDAAAAESGAGGQTAGKRRAGLDAAAETDEHGKGR
jgi:2-keto-4-pentenoate hydratase/2-oxohepta-3-ene-1,7-dioic acid hydratase in catechol pathway